MLSSARLGPAFALLALAACSTGPASSPEVAAPVASHATSPAPGLALPTGAAARFTGTVAETMNSGGFTYMRLQSGEEEIWAVANEFPVKVGDSQTVSLDTPMGNFHSSTLNRTFDMVYLVVEVEGATQAAPPPAAAGQTAVQPQTPPEGGLSIADVWAKRTELSGTPVTVRGTIVKVNNGILGSNWFHLQDGSGSAMDGTNDLTVTTSALVTVGDVVTVTGTLGTNKDFGAGYAYDAILESGTIRK